MCKSWYRQRSPWASEAPSASCPGHISRWLRRNPGYAADDVFVEEAQEGYLGASWRDARESQKQFGYPFRIHKKSAQRYLIIGSDTHFSWPTGQVFLTFFSWFMTKLVVSFGGMHLGELNEVNRWTPLALLWFIDFNAGSMYADLVGTDNRYNSHPPVNLHSYGKSQFKDDWASYKMVIFDCKMLVYQRVYPTEWLVLSPVIPGWFRACL